MTARLDSFSHAIVRLNEALVASETDLNRDAAIQRFEFCFELAWKVIQEQAWTEGIARMVHDGSLRNRRAALRDQRAEP